MLSHRERLAAVTLAQLADADRERTLQRGYIMVNIQRESASGVWTPVNLDESIIAAAKDFRRASHSDQTEYTVSISQN